MWQARVTLRSRGNGTLDVGLLPIEIWVYLRNLEISSPCQKLCRSPYILTNGDIGSSKANIVALKSALELACTVDVTVTVTVTGTVAGTVAGTSTGTGADADTDSDSATDTDADTNADS